ncbi:MAG: Aquaporin [Thermoproteota archaeon]|nr:Aquaporin [Thermoproteota archaeon]
MKRRPLIAKQLQIERTSDVNSDVKKYLAELLGTFVLVFIGCGSAVVAGEYIGFVGISFAFGLSVVAMAYAIGGISGCHINPAISISMLAAGKMKLKDTVIYIAMQCIGAVIAAAALYGVAVGKLGYNLAVNGLGQNGYDLSSPAGFSMTSSFITEVILTFIFLLVVHGSTSNKAPKGVAGIAIGLSLVVIHLVGIPITGTSVNPARSLGPAIIVGGTALSQLWLFWVAPIIGGLLAAAIWKIFEPKQIVVP